MDSLTIGLRINVAVFLINFFIMVGIIVTGGLPIIPVIAMAATIGPALWCKGRISEYEELHAARQPKALERGDCPVYFQRQFDMKMLNEGIITDEEVSVCDEDECPECAQTKRTIKFNKDRERRELEATKYNQEIIAKKKAMYEISQSKRLPTKKSPSLTSYKCGRCGSTLAYDGVCEPCHYDSAEGKKSFVGGQWIPRPPEVPAHAHGSVNPSDPRMVLWKWTDQSTGFPMGRSSYHPEYLDFTTVVKTADTLTTTINAGIITAGSIRVDSMSHTPECTCDYSEIEVDQLLDSAAVFRSGDCDKHNSFSDKTIDRRIEKLHNGVYDDKTIDELTELGIPESEILKRLNRPEPLTFRKPEFDYEKVRRAENKRIIDKYYAPKTQTVRTKR